MSEIKSITDQEILSYWNSIKSVRGVAIKLGISWQRVMKSLSSLGIIVNNTHAKITQYHKEELRKIEEEQDYNMRKAYLKAKRRQRLREERQRKVRMIVKNVVYGGFGLLFTSVMLIAGIIFTLCI